MTLIETQLEIDAPMEIAFDLSRSIDFHMYAQVHNNEVAIDGVTSGLIDLGQTVTWRARHFGISQELTAKITKFDRPHHFRDTMVCGAFKWFEHDHFFKPYGKKIMVTDRFEYESSYSIFGKIFDKLILEDYMTTFFINRNNLLKQVLEDGSWKEFIKT